MPDKILVGTASWSDPGFVADWYPKKMPAGERLKWYAVRFNLVEVNSSFYAIPSRKLVRRWCDQTSEGFTFDVKLHRLLSRHATTPDALPRELRSRASTRNGKVELSPELELAVARRFLEEIEPFADCGKLGSLLLQLSPAFKPGLHDLHELNPLLDCLRDHSVVVELRHRDWVAPNRLKNTVDYLRQRRVTLVSVDAPRQAHFTIMPDLDAVTNPRLAYLRCHGRNASGYIRGQSVAERFDYCYNERELQELAARAVKLAEQADAVHVLYNNNTSHYAPTNAARFREILEQEHPQVTTGRRDEEPRLRTMELALSGTVKD